jgi:hypothetical protein
MAEGDTQRGILSELVNPLESAINLVYLIQHDYNNPKKVQEWADLAEGQLQILGQLVLKNLR